MFTFIMLLAASAAETAPLSDELVDLEGQIDDLEKDGSWVEDPLDGEEKAHLVNREEAVRAYVSEDGAFTLANRLDDTVRVEFRVGKGYARPEVGDDLVAHDAGGVQQLWINTPDGIEHIITLDAPTGDTGLEEVHLNTSGLPFDIVSATEVHFTSGSGAGFKYAGLSVWDAETTALPAWFDVGPDGGLTIAFSVDDTTIWPVTIDPMATSHFSFIQFATNPSTARFGAQMAVGDFDGDGIKDLVVGADRHSNPAESQSGIAQAFAGDTSTPFIPMWSFDPHLANERCGANVAAGDLDGVNGDDVAILCSSGIKVFLNTGTGVRATALPTSANFTITSALFLATSEQAMVIGEFDQTTPKDEIVIASGTTLQAFRLDNGNTSASSVAAITLGGTGVPRLAKMRLTTSDLRDDVVVERGRILTFFEGNATSTLVASSAASLNFSALTSITFAPCDYDGDGASDLLIGDPTNSSNRGRVLVKDNNGSGAFSNNANNGGVAIGNAATAQLGTAVGGFDINNDQHDDLILCGTGMNSGVGGCTVIAGAPRTVEPSGIEATIFANIVPGSGGSAAGDAPPIAGDFRGDGARDVILPQMATSRVWAFDGDSAGLQTSTFLAPQGSQASTMVNGVLGAGNSTPALASLGAVVLIADVNQDGNEDLVLGAPGFDSGGAGRGAVFIYSGAQPMSTTPTRFLRGLQNGESFGSSIAVGHFRGYTSPPSIAVGSPDFDVSTHSSAGVVRVYHAPTNGFPSNNATANQTHQHELTSERFGFSLANGGNIYASLGDALLIGAPGGKTGTPSGGQVFVIPTCSGVTGLCLTTSATTPVATGTGVSCVSSFGTYVANAGNVVDAATSRTDMLVGAPDCDVSGTDEGKVFLYKSNSGASVSLTTWSAVGHESGAGMGVVAGLGDIDGDLIDDFAVGAPHEDNGTHLEAGRVYVYRGVSSGVPSLTKLISMSTTFDGNCGSSIAGGSVDGSGVFKPNDLNEDGLGDFAEGEPSFSDDVATPGEGRVRVFFGAKPNGPDATPESTIEGGCDSCALGASVALGDVNDDHHDDLGMGEPGYESNATTEHHEGRALLRLGQW
jgi:FG-GAP repeat